MTSQALLSDRKRQAQQTAVHEAGHADVATAMGFTPTRMWIDVDDGGGYCEYDDDYPDLRAIKSPRTLERVLVCDLGGPVAASLWAGRDPRPVATHMVAREYGPRRGADTKPLEIATRIFEQQGRGHDHAVVDAYRWLDEAIPKATETAIDILERDWETVLTYAAVLVTEHAVELPIHGLL